MGKVMKHIKQFAKEFIKHNLLFHSAQNAFYFILSLFPFLYILTKALIIIPLPPAEALKSFKILFPEETFEIIHSHINSISDADEISNSFPYILVALWSASMQIYSLKSLFGTFYDTKAHKSKLLIRIISVVLTFIILIIILFTFIIIFFLNITINILVKKLSVEFSSTLLSSISLVLIFFDVVLLYIILPPTRTKISQAIPGAILAIIALTASSYGFSCYLNYISDYSRFYGAMGSLIILLLWLYICSIVILSGGLVNAEFYKEKDTH
jgi:membrane protein